MDNKLDNYFEIFMELYREGNLRLSLRKKSFALSFEEKAKNKIDDKKEFRKFTSKLLNGLRQKILQEKVDEEYRTYEEYINSLLEYDPELKADIITRCEGNINICNRIDYEILTKRNKKLEAQCYSLLINLNLEKPSFDEEILEQINFELSIKDLRNFHRILDEAIGKIEKLNKDCSE